MKTKLLFLLLAFIFLLSIMTLSACQKEPPVDNSDQLPPEELLTVTSPNGGGGLVPYHLGVSYKAASTYDATKEYVTIQVRYYIDHYLGTGTEIRVYAYPLENYDNYKDTFDIPETAMIIAEFSTDALDENKSIEQTVPFSIPTSVFQTGDGDKKIALRIISMHQADDGTWQRDSHFDSTTLYYHISEEDNKILFGNTKDFYKAE